MTILRQGLKAVAALVTVAGLLFGTAYLFDPSGMRVLLGITPELDVPYVTTRRPMVDAMLEMAEVEADDYVIDLGTGDGRILIAAARDYGASGVGVDLDPVMVSEARDNAVEEGVEERVTFREQDLFETRLGEASVVTMFLLPEVNLRLRPRLFEQLAPGSRVVSHRFDMGDWRPDAERRVAGYPAYLWIIPADVAGNWTLETDGLTIPLELTQSFQDVQGNAFINGEPQPFNAQLEGDRLRFTLSLDRQPREFSGRVSGDSFTPMNGNGWSAVRVSGQ